MPLAPAPKDHPIRTSITSVCVFVRVSGVYACVCVGLYVCVSVQPFRTRVISIITPTLTHTHTLSLTHTHTHTHTHTCSLWPLWREIHKEQ